MEKSSCIYCQSNSYGTGCSYSPTSTHVHMDNPGKCIYCGSPSIGSGCSFNPYGDIHIKAAEYLNRSAVQTEKATLLSYFLNVATSLFKESYYKSPLDRLYKRISCLLTSTSEPFLEAFNLQETPLYANLSKEDFVKVVDLKNKLKTNLKELRSTIKEGNLNFSQEVVEKAIIDAILDINID